MKKAKIILGVCFLIIGSVTSIGSFYLLQEDRLSVMLDSDSNLKIEISFLLIFSILLSYSGFKTIQKEYKNEKFQQSELLDD